MIALKALTALGNATGFVVTRTFLGTLEALDRLDLTEKLHRPLYATPALLHALHREREEHVETSLHGRTAMGKHRGVNRLIETPPETGKRFLARTQRLIDWVEEHCRVHLPDRLRSPSSQYLDDGANEALAATRQLQCALLTDDLGLRRLAGAEFGVQGGSTYALLLFSHEKGLVSHETAEDLISHLIEMGHAAIPFTVELAMRSLNRDPQRLSSFEIAMRHLRAKYLDVGRAALLVSRLLRSVFVEPSLRTRTAGIAQLCFAALLSRGALERANAERYLSHFITQDFLLFPDERDRLLIQLNQTAPAV